MLKGLTTDDWLKRLGDKTRPAFSLAPTSPTFFNQRIAALFGPQGKRGPTSLSASALFYTTICTITDASRTQNTLTLCTSAYLVRISKQPPKLPALFLIILHIASNISLPRLSGQSYLCESATLFSYKIAFYFDRNHKTIC
jgi:hypothetical protein